MSCTFFLLTLCFFPLSPGRFSFYFLLFLGWLSVRRLTRCCCCVCVCVCCVCVLCVWVGVIVAVCWGKEEHQLVSASYDETIKVWDIRSTVPLYTIAAHNGKVLCLAVGPAGEILSGGTDGKLKRFVDPNSKAAAA